MSIERGIEPGGISFEFSFTRTRWKSTNFDFLMLRCYFLRLLQVGFLQMRFRVLELLLCHVLLCVAIHAAKIA